MNPIIIALDVDTAGEARRIVDAVGGATNFYKVGMELYAAAGMDFVRELKDKGCQVFLDMKFYDIGETVKRAIAQVAKSGVDMLTVHGSKAVMRAAVEGRGSSALKLLGVKMLTSFDETCLAAFWYPCRVQELVSLRAKIAWAGAMSGGVWAPFRPNADGAEAMTYVSGLR